MKPFSQLTFTSSNHFVRHSAPGVRDSLPELGCSGPNFAVFFATDSRGVVTVFVSNGTSVVAPVADSTFVAFSERGATCSGDGRAFVIGATVSQGDEIFVLSGSYPSVTATVLDYGQADLGSGIANTKLAPNGELVFYGTANVSLGYVSGLFVTNGLSQTPILLIDQSSAVVSDYFFINSSSMLLSYTQPCGNETKSDLYIARGSLSSGPCTPLFSSELCRFLSFSRPPRVCISPSNIEQPVRRFFGPSLLPTFHRRQKSAFCR